MKKKKQATADLESLKKIFTLPEDEHSTLSIIEKEISKNINEFLSQHIVAGDLSPSAIEQDFQETRIPENPIFVSEQAHFLMSKVVAQSVHTSSPSFIGHMTSAVPYFMLPLGKIMMALNQNLVKTETSKAFTPLERQVIGMLHRLVFDRDEHFYQSTVQNINYALGTFCSGGSIANITALWVARNKFFAPSPGFAGIKKLGLAQALQQSGFKNLAVLVSKRGHYSLSKASDILGIGQDCLIKIKTDDSNKMSPAHLKKTIRSLKSQKVGILAVVGIAGTTETGNVDPLDQIADICAQEKCHFHVDAAWGGPTLFSRQHRHLLKGIERADSVTFDAHKQLYVPIGAGIALFRDQTALAHIEQRANYIIREGSRDLGKHSLEGSRPGMAVMVHSGLRVIGKKGYELLIDQGISKAQKFSQLIAEQDDFEIITEPELNLLTFRYLPKKIRKHLEGCSVSTKSKINEYLNELTTQIQKDQRTAGRTFLSRTTLESPKYNYQNIIVFRSVLANPLVTNDILISVLNEVRSIGRSLLRQEPFSRYFSGSYNVDRV